MATLTFDDLPDAKSAIRFDDLPDAAHGIRFDDLPDQSPDNQLAASRAAQPQLTPTPANGASVASAATAQAPVNGAPAVEPAAVGSEYEQALASTQEAQNALMGPGSIVGGTLLAGQLVAEERLRKEAAEPLIKTELPYPENLQPGVAQEFSTPETPSSPLKDQLSAIAANVTGKLASSGLTMAAGYEFANAKGIHEAGSAVQAARGLGLPDNAFETPEYELEKSKAATERAQQFSVDAQERGQPIAPGAITSIIRGLTGGVEMAAIAKTGGIPLMALAGAAESYGAAKGAGHSDEEAETAATHSLIGLALFGASNATVAKGITGALGKGAGPLKTFLVQALGQSAGNEVTGRAIAAGEAAEAAPAGQKVDAALAALKANSLETTAMNVGFGLHGAMGAAGRVAAARKAEVPAPIAEATAALVRTAQAAREVSPLAAAEAENLAAEIEFQARKNAAAKAAQPVVVEPPAKSEAPAPVAAEERPPAEAAPTVEERPAGTTLENATPKPSTAAETPSSETAQPRVAPEPDTATAKPAGEVAADRVTREAALARFDDVFKELADEPPTTPEAASQATSPEASKVPAERAAESPPKTEPSSPVASEQLTPAREPLSTFDKALQDELRAYRKEVEQRPVEQQPPRMWYELEAAKKGIGPQELSGDEVRAYKQMWQNAVDAAVRQNKPVFVGGKYFEKPPKKGWTQVGDLWQPPAGQGPVIRVRPDPMLRVEPPSAIAEAPGAGAKLEAAPAPVTAEPAPKRTFRRKIPEAPGGHDAVESLLSEIGKIQHPETARRDALRREGKGVGRTTGRGGHYDGWMNLPAQLRKLIFLPVGQHSNVTPDTAAQAAYEGRPAEDGSGKTIGAFLDRPDHDALLDAIKSAWQTRLNVAKGEKLQAREEKQAGKIVEQQDKAFAKAAKDTSKPAVQAGELSVGDKVNVGGEEMRVTDVDADTGDVTLEDGSKFGLQTVKDGEAIYGEHEAPPPDPNVDPWLELDTTEKVVEAAKREGLTDENKPDAQSSAGGEPERPADTEGQESVPESLAPSAGVEDQAGRVAETPLEKARRVLAEREEELRVAREEGDRELVDSLSKVLPKLRRDAEQVETAPQPAPASDARLQKLVLAEISGLMEAKDVGEALDHMQGIEDNAVRAEIARQYGIDTKGKDADTLNTEIAAKAIESGQPPVADTGKKELWQVTRDQVGEMKAKHREAVRDAVKAGKPVPDEVLDEYRASKWADKEMAKRRKAAKAAEAKVISVVSEKPSTSEKPVETTTGGEVARAQFSPDDTLIMHSPHTGEDVEVSYRGPLGDKSVVWTGKSQMAIPTEWLRRKQGYQPPKDPNIGDDYLKARHDGRFEEYKADESAYAKAIDEWLATIPANKAIIFKQDAGNGSRYTAVTRDTGGAWRTTHFDETIEMPYSHEVFKTRLEAVKSLRGWERIEKLPFTVKAGEFHGQRTPYLWLKEEGKEPRLVKFGGYLKGGETASVMDSKNVYTGEWETVVADNLSLPSKEETASANKSEKEQFQKYDAEQAKEREVLRKQIERTGIIDVPGGDVRIKPSNVEDGKFDLVKTVNGKREIISNPEKPGSLEDMQTGAVHAAMRFRSAEPKPKSEAPKLVEGQNQGDLTTPVRYDSSTGKYNPPLVNGDVVRWNGEDYIVTRAQGFTVGVDKLVNGRPKVWGGISVDHTSPEFSGDLVKTGRNFYKEMEKPKADPFGELVSGGEVNTGKTAHVTNEEAGTLVRVGGQVVAKLNQKGGVFVPELNEHGAKLTDEQKATVEQAARDYTKTWQAAKIREGSAKSLAAADLTTQLDMLETGRSESPLFEQKPADSPAAEKSAFLNQEPPIAKDWTDLTKDELPPLGQDMDGYFQWSTEVAKSILPKGSDIEIEALRAELRAAISTDTAAKGVEAWQNHIVAHRVAAELLTGGRQDILVKAKARALADEHARWEMGGRFDGDPISVEAHEAGSKGRPIPDDYERQGANFVKKAEPPAKPDKIKAALDTAIDNLAQKPGELFSDPIFIQSVGKPVLRAALQIVRAAYEGGMALAKAVELGVAHIREAMKADGKEFDETKTREFFGQFTAAEAEAAKKAAPPEPPTAGAEPTAPEQSPTGIRNEIVDKERVARGLPERMAPLRRSFGKIWDEAMVKADEDPQAGSRLVAEIIENPRPLEDWESALLAHEQVTRQNAFDKAVERLNANPGNVEATTRLAEARDSVQAIYDAGQKAGTKSGQSLAARKLLVNEDFSLAKMEATWRAEVNGGKPLNEAQAKEIAELHQRIAESDAKIARFEEMEAKAEAARVFDEVLKEAKKAAKVTKQNGSRVASFLADQAAKAKERIIARRGKLFTTVDPLNVAGLVDEAIIGASHIANGITKLSEWSTKMLSDFGDRLKPFLPALFEKAKEYHATISSEIAAKTGKKTAEAPTPESLIANAKPGTDLDPKLVFDLARAHVNAGVTGMEAVMKAVHADLVPLHEGLTEREVRDAFSGYGKTSFPSREADLTALREYKNLARLTSQLEDAQRRIAPLKTGPQRDKASQAVRALTKQVKETMRRLGIETTTPEQQLKTSLDAVKTRLQNQIEDLTKQIATRTKPEGKTPIPYDAEATALKTERDHLAGIAEEIFGKPELTEAQRIATATKALDRSIAEEDALLKAGVLKRPAKESKTPLTPELESKRALLDAMRELRVSLYEAANPKRTPEQIQLARDKKMIARRTIELLERVKTNNYAPKPKRVPQVDAEKTALLFENAKAKEAYLRGKFEEMLKQRSLGQKIFDTGRETLNTSRAILTSVDLSAPGRQGGFIAMAHPIRAAKSLIPMLKAFASEKAAFKVNEEINSRPNAPLYAQSKLFLSDQHSISLTKMEEIYMSRLALKIPVVAGSQRAYSTFLNKLRADSFDAMAKTLSRGGQLSIEEAKAISNFINVATGRGSIPGAAAQAAAGLNSVFFAPRYVLSRFQLLAGQPFYGGNARTRALIAGEYARYLIGVGVVYSLAVAAQDDKDPKVETDPTSSNFLKVRFGNTRLDLMSGLLQATVFSAREGKALQHFADQDKKKEPKYGGGADVLGRFLRSKLSPAVGTAVDALAGKDVTGQTVTPKSAALRLITPISPGDIFKALEEQKIPKGIALSLLSLLGHGVQTYDEKRSRR